MLGKKKKDTKEKLENRVINSMSGSGHPLWIVEVKTKDPETTIRFRKADGTPGYFNEITSEWSQHMPDRLSKDCSSHDLSFLAIFPDDLLQPKCSTGLSYQAAMSWAWFLKGQEYGDKIDVRVQKCLLKFEWDITTTGEFELID